MTALWVLGAALLALWLIGRVRLGVQTEYDEAGLRVWARAGRLWLRIYPAKQKNKRPAKEKRGQVPPPPIAASKKVDALELLRAYLPPVAESAGQLRRRVRVDHLDLELLVAGSDPAATALAYGWANAALGVMIPLLENNFHIKERSVRTGLSFDSGSTQVRLKAALSLTVGQCTALGLRLALQFLQITAKQKKVQKEAV